MSKGQPWPSSSGLLYIPLFPGLLSCYTRHPSQPGPDSLAVGGPLAEKEQLPTKELNSLTSCIFGIYICITGIGIYILTVLVLLMLS